MNVIKYNVNSGDVCQIGRQYEYGKTQVIFEGYQVIDSANEIYFKFVGRTDDSKYLIPIIDMTLDITQQLTKHVGQFSCQLEEMNTEGTLVSQSPVFCVAVKRSIKVGADYEVQDPRLETIYQKYNAMYNTINDTNNTVLANESQRQAEWITLKQEVADAVASIDGKLDWYKASTTDTLQARLNGFIGEAEGSIQTALETYETQTDSNINDKLTAYQSKTTSDINRMFDDSDRTSKEKIDALASELDQRRLAGEFNGSDGYTPVKGKDYFTESEIVQFKKDVTPKKRIDYFTDSEISQIQNEVSSGAIGEFRVVVQTETDNFNTNAANKVSEFDAHTEQIQADISELKSDLNNLENVLLVDKSEDIYPSLSWTIGFMAGDGSIYSDSDAVLQYSNKIPVKSGDVLEISADNAGSFRFVTAFNNDTALIDLATQNVKSYTVKEDTNFVVVTTYVNAENKHIVKKYKDYIDVVTDITKLKTDVSKVIPMVTYDDSYLPTEMYFVVNKEYEIYHNQICHNAENYTFKWSYGTNYGNRVRIKYDTVGTRTVTCTIYNANGTQAKILSVNINVVEKVTKNVYLLPFGDSLTNHCVWESELMNMAENIVCVGSRSRIIADSDGENRTVYNEGRAGFTSFNYTNGSQYVGGTDGGGDEAPHNRWYDPTTKKFSTSYYFTNNLPSSQHIPTMFTFFLGMNDLVGSTSCNDISENIKSMINDIRSYMPDIPIVLIAPQIRYLSNLTGYEHVRFLEFSKTLENLSKEYTNMVFIPLCYGMDSLNNYNMRDITINTRSTITEKTAGDVTHPNKTGYWQIADMVLGAISYLA